MLIYVTLVVVLQYLSESTIINYVINSLVSKNGWRRWFRHVEMLLLAYKNKEPNWVCYSKQN